MRSVRVRIALAIFVVVLLVGSLAFVATDRAYRLILDTVAADTITAGQRGFENVQTYRTERLAIATQMLMADPAISDAFADGDRERLLELTYPRFEQVRDQFEISREYFYLPDDAGTVFLRTYLGEAALDPENFGDASGSKVLEATRRSGGIKSGLELGRSRLSLRVASPFRDADGAVLGFIAMAEGVHDYLKAVSAQTGDGYALFISKSQLERDAWAEVQAQAGHEDTWDDLEDVVLVDSTLQNPVTIDAFDPEQITAEARHLDYVRRGDAVYAAGVFPILDTTGVPVGRVFVERDLTQIVQALRRVQLGLITAFILLAFVAAAGSFVLVERMVFRRFDATLQRMERTALAAAAGEHPHVPEVAAENQDEFTRFEHFFAGLAAMVADAVRSRNRGVDGVTDDSGDDS